MRGVYRSKNPSNCKGQFTTSKASPLMMSHGVTGKQIRNRNTILYPSRADYTLAHSDKEAGRPV